jgi:hypothetical protein
VVLDGALAFANADASVVELLVGTDKSVYLPAGAGAFVGHINVHGVALGGALAAPE